MQCECEGPILGEESNAKGGRAAISSREESSKVGMSKVGSVGMAGRKEGGRYVV